MKRTKQILSAVMALAVLFTGAVHAQNTPANAGLKDIYASHFRVGNILNNGTVNNSGIQNLIKREYNSVTAENEHKPDATMTKTGSTNTDIKATLNTGARAIMKFCQDNNIPMRGHVLTWHGQTPDWFFIKDINDPRGDRNNANAYRNGPVSSVPWADTATMNRRLESYIKNLFELIKKDYPRLVFYAYDVVNEACAGNGGMRPRGFDHNGAGGQGSSNAGDSPWQGVYGANNTDWIRNAFTYARKYAPEGTKLFYNDFNEWHAPKRDYIINSILKPLFRDGILDGMGMQGHVSADPAQGAWSRWSVFKEAMDKYGEIDGLEIQITEMDVATEGGQYVTQQTERYRQTFEYAIEVNKRGKGRFTAICIWAPNDANTWIRPHSNGRSNTPSLHDNNNNPKAAYTAVAGVVPQSDWGNGNNPTFGGGNIKPPEPNEYGWWFHDPFEDNVGGWDGRGNASADRSTQQKALGSRSLAVTGRTDYWHGAIKTLPSVFKADSVYSFSVCAMYSGGEDIENIKFTLEYTNAADSTRWTEIAAINASRGQWIQLANRNFKIPAGAKNLKIIIESPTDSTITLYIDEVIGAVAGTNIAAPEGVSTTGATGIAIVNKKSVNPVISLRGRTLNITSPANSELQIRVIDVKGRTAAKFNARAGRGDIRPSAVFSLKKIPAGRYFVEVKGKGIRHNLPIMIK